MSPRTKSQISQIKTEKRKIILAAAIKLFANSGFHATSISKIANEANISKGLLYNYFESKEALLLAILDEITTNIMDMMNPDHDDEITSQEMEDFFTLIINSLKTNNEHWKLYYQVTIQKGVFEYLLKEMQSEKVIHNQKLIYKYFAERFENPEVELLLFSSIIKGFSLQYIFAPEMFQDEILHAFKGKLRELIIRPKKYKIKEI